MCRHSDLERCAAEGVVSWCSRRKSRECYEITPIVCLSSLSTFFTLFAGFVLKLATCLSFSGKMPLLFRLSRADKWSECAIWLESVVLRFCSNDELAFCRRKAIGSIWLNSWLWDLFVYCHSGSCCDLASLCPWKSKTLWSMCFCIKMDTTFISNTRKPNFVVGLWMKLWVPFLVRTFLFWSPGDSFSLACEGDIVIVKLPERFFCFLIPAWALRLLPLPAADVPAIAEVASLRCFLLCCCRLQGEDFVSHFFA